jgi:hypothetical protein
VVVELPFPNGFSILKVVNVTPLIMVAVMAMKTTLKLNKNVRTDAAQLDNQQYNVRG